MNNKRQATASAKGYILQSYFGIYFFFKDENYKEIDWVKIEGEKEDIEIYYYDKTKDYIQVKTQEKPAKATCFDGKKFKKGKFIFFRIPVLEVIKNNKSFKSKFKGGVI